ncbi:hypothetical protein BDZ97DRAFT_1886056 [Flammula alnicola]|nr:hypothetical protein BDZ97DRAFT_1886056 [Flammula alnicola]
MLKSSIRRSLAPLCEQTRVPRLNLPYHCSPSLRLARLTVTYRYTTLDKPSGRTVPSQCRSYSTSGKEVPPHEDTPADSTEDAPFDLKWMMLRAFENTASAPWLNLLAPDHEDRLRRAYSLFFQIKLTLSRVQDPEEAIQFLFEFDNVVPVPPTSEVGRARRVVAILTHTIVNQISSIPLSSPVREKYPDIFNIHGALVPLSDIHLEEPDGAVEDWREFWARAQPVLFGLGEKLHEAGFGIDSEG